MLTTDYNHVTRQLVRNVSRPNVHNANIAIYCHILQTFYTIYKSTTDYVTHTQIIRSRRILQLKTCCACLHGMTMLSGVTVLTRVKS